MVTARSLGPARSALRQRAARKSSAVESGPPETARTSTEARAREPNRALASAAVTGAASAADTLLFSIHSLLHSCRCTREFAQDFAERGAGRLLFAERGQRLPQAKEGVRRPGSGFELGRDVEEGFRRITETLALEQTFSKPIGGIAGEPIVGISAQEAAEAVLGQRVVLAQQVTIGEIVFVSRRLRGRQRGE